MGRTHAKFKAAVIQASPVFMDLEATVDKTIAFIKEASEAGARLIAFPETWIPGYPLWLWTGSAAFGMQFVQQYHDNSLVIDSDQMQRICDAAAEAEMYVFLGFSEKHQGSLFMGQGLIGPDGQIIFTRRKLKPTHVERTLYGEGDGRDFKVAETELGKVGGLCCWEHLQPLSKYAMYSLDEQIHVSAWPTFSIYPGKANALSADVNMSATKTYAVEGQCFVLAPTIVTTQDIIDEYSENPDQPLLEIGGGASAIFAPDGQVLTESLAPTEEGLLYADIDVGMISLAKAVADPAGHYSRPDVTQLLLHTEARDPVVYAPEKIMAKAPQPVSTSVEEEEAA